MKFEINEKIRVKATGRIGTVIGYKYEIHLEKGVKTTKVQYSVNFGTYLIDWYKEEDLDHFNKYEFDKKFELGLLDFLIDIYLLNRKLDLVKQLCEEKKIYTGVKE